MVTPAVVHDINHIRGAFRVKCHSDGDPVKVSSLDPWRFRPFSIAVPDHVIHLEHGHPLIKSVRKIIINCGFAGIHIDAVVFPDDLTGTVMWPGYVLK